MTKIKAIGPCVQKLEANMEVKLAFLVVTLLTRVYITLNISKTMNSENLVVHGFADIEGNIDPSQKSVTTKSANFTLILASNS